MSSCYSDGCSRCGTDKKEFGGSEFLPLAPKSLQYLAHKDRSVPSLCVCVNCVLISFCGGVLRPGRCRGVVCLHPVFLGDNVSGVCFHLRSWVGVIYWRLSSCDNGGKIQTCINFAFLFFPLSALVVYCTKSRRAERYWQKTLLQMEEMESQIREEIRKGLFTQAQTRTLTALKVL